MLTYSKCSMRDCTCFGCLPPSTAATNQTHPPTSLNLSESAATKLQQLYLWQMVVHKLVSCYISPQYYHLTKQPALCLHHWTPLGIHPSRVEAIELTYTLSDACNWSVPLNSSNYWSNSFWCQMHTATPLSYCTNWY